MGRAEMEESAMRSAVRVAPAALAVVLLARAVLAAPAVSNLLANGNFEDAAEPLRGWCTDYRAEENRWYMNNHLSVSVLPRDGARRGVLKFQVSQSASQNEGVKVDSLPVPYEFGAKYRLTVTARAKGPNARILIEGYQWKPGVKPYGSPVFTDLRKTYRQGGGQMLYFGTERGGAFSNPGAAWQTASCVFPGDELSALAKQHLERVRFLSVHIVGIGGGAGELFVDEVVLEKVKEP
jgi:hypothetical protein